MNIMPNYFNQPSMECPEVWDWIIGLPLPSQWKSDEMSLKL